MTPVCSGHIGKTIYSAQPCPEQVVWETIPSNDERHIFWCERHGAPLRNISHPKVKWIRLDQYGNPIKNENLRHIERS